jgi:hypothetical protein
VQQRAAFERRVAAAVDDARRAINSLSGAPSPPALPEHSPADLPFSSFERDLHRQLLLAGSSTGGTSFVARPSRVHPPRRLSVDFKTQAPTAARATTASCAQSSSAAPAQVPFLKSGVPSAMFLQESKSTSIFSQPVATPLLPDARNHQGQCQISAASSGRILRRIKHHVTRFLARSRPGAAGGATPPPLTPSPSKRAQQGGPVDFKGHSFAYAQKPSAVPIVASQVSLPSEQDAVADLLDILPPPLAARFASEAVAPLRPLVELQQPPAVHAFAERSEYVALVRLMQRRGLVQYTFVTPRAENGCFAVPKPDGTSRFIVDARPANLLFEDPPDPCLPSPEHIARLQPPPGQRVLVGKTDLSNMYHGIRLPAWMRPFFALPQLSAAELQLDGIAAATPVWPVCTRLPMGFSWAVFLAQQAHRRTVLAAGVPESALIDAATTDFRLDRLRVAIYIDDVVCFAPEPLSYLIGGFQERYIVVATAEHFTVHRVKRHGARLVAEVFGLEFDGAALLYGLSAPKMLLLVQQTRAFIAVGFSTAVQLERVIGSWTWAMLPSRPALAAFKEVYRFTAIAGRKPFALWRGVVAELSTAIGLAPLLVANVGAPFWHSAIATDASSTGTGVVAARLPPSLQSFAAAVAGPASLPPQALSLSELVAAAALAPDEVPRQRQYEPSAGLATLLRVASWRTIVSARWRWQDEHINKLEARTVNTAVRWALSSPAAVDCRLLLLCDSAAVVASAHKGRSSARAFYKTSRVLSALLLAAGIKPAFVWLPSALNPADGPSRQ